MKFLKYALVIMLVSGTANARDIDYQKLLNEIGFANDGELVLALKDYVETKKKQQQVYELLGWSEVSELSFKKAKSLTDADWESRRVKFEPQIKSLNEQVNFYNDNLKDKNHDYNEAVSDFERCQNFSSINGGNCSGKRKYAENRYEVAKRAKSKLDYFYDNEYKPAHAKYTRISEREYEAHKKYAKEVEEKINNQVSKEDIIFQFQQGMSNVRDLSWEQQKKHILDLYYGRAGTVKDETLARDYLVYGANLGSNKAIKLMQELNMEYANEHSIVVKNVALEKEFRKLFIEFYNKKSEFAGKFKVKNVIEITILNLIDEPDEYGAAIHYSYSSLSGSELGKDMRTANYFKNHKTGEWEFGWLDENMSAKLYF